MACFACFAGAVSLQGVGTSVRNWLLSFVGERELETPDGRPLYAYRCTQSEFVEVAERLSAAGRDGQLGEWEIRAFVLYAAEWWQRRYDGGPWSWEPILRHVGWDDVPYPELYEPVQRALGWWRVELVRLGVTTRYLGTFACQGGLPMSLVGESSRVRAYLRGVLRHVARYRQFVDDSIELARDQQHLLRPPTVRREYVFRLAADLVDTILDLREAAEGEDVLASLDAQRPGWRMAMPLDLDNETARDLLAGLLREAKTGSPAGSGFGVERFLVRTTLGWRIGARVRMPRTVAREELGLHLNASESTLPPRMHVRVAGLEARVVGLYGAGGDGFHQVSVERSAANTFWDEDAIREFRLEFFAQEVVGEVVVRRGSSLGELPWAFRAEDGECAFVGEGTVSDRSPALLVLLPPGVEPNTGEALDVDVVDRRLWRLSEPTYVETANGKCAFHPSSEQMADEDYRLSGDRFYGLASAYPLFRGDVRLNVAKAEEPRRAVPAQEVSWRLIGGEWQPRPVGFGLWEVRRVRQGTLRHHERVGLLPHSFALTVRPGSTLSDGELELHGSAGVGVADGGSGVNLEIVEIAEGLRICAKALDTLAPPAEVALRLFWRRASELPVRAPFPGEGARFLRNGRPLDGVLAVDDLYGVRAAALSTSGTQRFWIDGELKAADVASVKAVAYFRRELRRSGIWHELALIEMDSMLRLLLGASTESEARVAVRIVDSFGKEHATAEVRRFAGTLEHDSTMQAVLVSAELAKGGAPTFEAVPLARADLTSISLKAVGPVESPVCATLPETLELDDEPWLVALRQDGDVHVEPVVVGGRSAPSAMTREYLSLREALRLRESARRGEEVSQALSRMIDDGDDEDKGGDAEWSFLTDMLLCLQGVPPASVELLRSLPRCPRVLVRCLFRLDPSLRRWIWQLEDALPFSWVLVQRAVWRDEATLAHSTICRELAGVVDNPARLASEHVLDVLAEGADRIGALDTVGMDATLALEGGTLSDEFVREVCAERDLRMRTYVHQFASEDDWPPGDGRSGWSQELERGQLMSAMWQDEKDPIRQPAFDTPVAAAWCCFLSSPTPRTVFLVKRMRAHAPEWFDIAYRAAWYRLAQLAQRQDTAKKDQQK